MAERREWTDLVVPVESRVDSKFIAECQIAAVGTDPDNGDLAIVVDLTQRGGQEAVRGVLTLSRDEASLLARSIGSTLRGTAQGN